MEKMSTKQLSKSYTEVSEVFKKFVERVAEVRVKDQFLNTPVLRVFVSVPMNGRTEEAIKEDIEEAKAAFNKFFGLDFDGDKIIFVDTYELGKEVDHDPTEENIRNPRIWFLGNSIKTLSTCDIVLFARGAYRATDCKIESRIADCYRIPVIRICDNFKYDEEDFEYYSGQLNIFVPEKEESKPKYMTEETYKEWRKVADEEDRREWIKVMNEVDGIEQR